MLLTALFLMLGSAWAQVPTASPAPENGQWNANTKWYTLTVNGGYVSLHNADGNGNLMLRCRSGNVTGNYFKATLHHTHLTV